MSKCESQYEFLSWTAAAAAASLGSERRRGGGGWPAGMGQRKSGRQLGGGRATGESISGLSPFRWLAGWPAIRLNFGRLAKCC
jgi:hypothetical protein